MGFPVSEPWRAEPDGYPQNRGPRDEAAGGTHPKAGSTCSRGKEGAGRDSLPSHEGESPGRGPPHSPPCRSHKGSLRRFSPPFHPSLGPGSGSHGGQGTQAAPQNPTIASATPETSRVPGEGAWIPESHLGQRGHQVRLRRGLPGSWGPTRSCRGCQGKGSRFTHATSCAEGGPGTQVQDRHTWTPWPRGPVH